MKLTATLGTLITLIGALPGHAQVLVVPVPYESGYVYGKGYGVNYKRGRLSLSIHLSSGTYGYSGILPAGSYVPYGLLSPPGYFPPPPPIVGRLTLANYHLTPQVRPAWRSEIEGIDLDQVPPRKQHDEPPPAVKAPEKEPALPGVDVSKPKPPVRPREDEPNLPNVNVPPPPRQNPPPEPPPPRVNPKEKNAHLIDLGLAAFATEEYGSAVQRFRQATQIEPNVALAHFLLAQAQFALGKYDESVAALQAGLRLHKTWPAVPFQPRLELYKGNELDFVAQLKRLEEALGKNASADLLFLYAYQLWFDGRRNDAILIFRQARQMVPDTGFIDRFLAAPPGPI